MQNLILTKAQAESIRDAMCAINNVGGKVSITFPEGNGQIRIDEYTDGFIVIVDPVKHGPILPAMEVYKNQNEFFTVYGVD